MIIDPPELRATYRQMVKGHADDQEFCDQAEQWYLEECGKLGDSRIWERRRRPMRNDAFKKVYSYIRGEMNERALYNYIRNGPYLDYYFELFTAGLVPPPPPLVEILNARKISALEAVKGYSALVGLDPQLQSTCDAVANVMATTWADYVQRLHALFDLPMISEILDGLIPVTEREREILTADNFTAYYLSIQDWLDYADEIGLNPSELPD